MHYLRYLVLICTFSGIFDERCLILFIVNQLTHTYAEEKMNFFEKNTNYLYMCKKSFYYIQKN